MKSKFQLAVLSCFIVTMFAATSFALSPPYPNFTTWTDTANGINYVDAGYTHAIVRDADGTYWFALRRLYNNPTSVYELFTSANNGSSWSSVGTYDTGQAGGCLADLRMYSLDNEIYIDTWCGGNYIYHVNKTNAQVITSQNIGYQGACGTNSTNLWCISSVGSNFGVTIFDKYLNILDSFTAPKPTGNDGGIGGIQFNQKEDLAEFIFWDAFTAGYYVNITANPVTYATHDFLNPSFESIQSDSSGGRLNPFNADIPLNWFTDYNFNRGMYYDDVDWANVTNGENIHVTGDHYYSGSKSLEFNITDMAVWGSNNYGIASQGGLNVSAGNNYQLTYYIEKPVVAPYREFVPNPSYELVRNTTLPQNWWQCDAGAGATIVCSSDEVTPFMSINDTAIDGSNSLKMPDDANGNAVTSISSDRNASSLSGKYNWSVLVNAGNGTDDGFDFFITNRTEIDNPYYYYFEGAFAAGEIDYLQCFVYNSTEPQTPITCNYDNMSGGWKKIYAEVNFGEAAQNYFFAAESWDNDAAENYILIDNFTLTQINTQHMLQETTPCTANGNYVATPVLRDNDSTNQVNMYICNSTDLLGINGGLFTVNSFSYTNVTGADGHTWQKYVLDFNVTANADNITLDFYSSILGTEGFVYYVDAVSITPVTTRVYSTYTNTYAGSGHAWDDGFLAFQNGRKFLVAGSVYKQSTDGTSWSGNVFSPANAYSKAAWLEDVGHNDTFIIYSTGTSLVYMESEDNGVSFGSPVTIIDNPSQDYMVQVRGSSYPSYNNFDAHNGYLDMIVGGSINNDTFFVPLLHEDTLAPEITITSPSGSVTSPFAINYNVESETGSPVDSCWYSIDSGTNYTLPSCANSTASAAVGLHSITVYANDTANNIGSTVSAFTIFLPPTANVTGSTASVYVVIPILAGLIMILYAINEMMKSQMDFKEAAVMIIVGILLIIVASAIVASNV